MNWLSKIFTRKPKPLKTIGMLEKGDMFWIVRVDNHGIVDKIPCKIKSVTNNFSNDKFVSKEILFVDWYQYYNHYWRILKNSLDKLNKTFVLEEAFRQTLEFEVNDTVFSNEEMADQFVNAKRLTLKKNLESAIGSSATQSDIETAVENANMFFNKLLNDLKKSKK